MRTNLAVDLNSYRQRRGRLKSRKRPAIAFIFDHKLKFPINLREYHVSLELASRRYRVIWFCAEPVSNTAIRSKFFTVPIRAKSITRGYPLYLAFMLKKYEIDYVWLSGWAERDLLSLFKIVSTLKAFGFRIIYDPIDPIYEYEIAQKRLQPLGSRAKQYRLLSKFIYFLSDITLIVTEQLRDVVVNNGGPQDKFRVVPWGTDLERFYLKRPAQDLRKNLELSHNFVIGWLGTMSHFKGIEEIIIPLIKTLPEYIDNVYFLIGGKGPLENRFLSLIQSLNDSVYLLGEVPYDLAPAFTAALDLYLIPINDNSDFARSILPVKLFDALVMGIPVIITATEATLSLSKTFRAIQYAEWKFSSFLGAVLNTYRNYKSLKDIAVADRNNAKYFTHQETRKQIVDIIEKL